ncbi:MAG TPA: hypothetical protein VK846_03755 [Candidatus Limnocylindria bacterium]|nr:hypothetical protein [Candidatus Limnocylindria bacterium]
MSDRDDILWSLQRQSRALQEVVADARLVWRDANARAAEQRFLQPRAASERTILTAIAAQHRDLNSAATDVLRADEQHRIAASESAQAGQNCADARASAQSAFSEASAASSQAQQADQLASDARNHIAQANSAGGG